MICIRIIADRSNRSITDAPPIYAPILLRCRAFADDGDAFVVDTLGGRDAPTIICSQAPDVGISMCLLPKTGFGGKKTVLTDHQSHGSGVSYENRPKKN